MIGLLLCVCAFATSYVAARRSLGHGFGVAMVYGYFYGILRANLTGAGAQFIFDSAVLGLYLARFASPPSDFERRKSSSARVWFILLLGWPLLLCLDPTRHILIQLVGLRFCAFFLPFLLLGALSKPEDWAQAARWVTVLNLVALLLAGIEYYRGVQFFYPRNPNTEIIYASAVFESGSNDLLRIPATFAHAQAYSATMISTLPICLWGYLRKPGRLWSTLFASGCTAATLGAFLSATRSTVLMGGVALIVLIVRHPRIVRNRGFLAVLALITGITLYVITVGDSRLHRFEQVAESGVVVERMNRLDNMYDAFASTAANYPLGNGLSGSFGINIPYFLLDCASGQTQIGTESEYIRVLATQGVVGLLLFVGFLIWLFTRPFPRCPEPQAIAMKFMYGWLLALSIGAWRTVGGFSAAPTAAFVFMLMGFLAQDPIPMPARVRRTLAARLPLGA